VEHNKFCVSVHFRNCEAEQYGAVLGAVEATLRARAELHASRGRKVFEIKPQARRPRGPDPNPAPSTRRARPPRLPGGPAREACAGGLLPLLRGCAGERAACCRAVAGKWQPWAVLSLNVAKGPRQVSGQ